MGTAKITEHGEKYDVEDADGDIHTGLTLDEAAELLDVDTMDVKQAIVDGQGGVGYLEFDEEENEDEEDEDEL
jgi:hypothetical protein